ncbi:TGF-beta-activated kinase 1 and MAP3K7-binding protein 3 isoform X2 [Homalodisca vitripennis]|nr:TGF-beta-activated kinase 1 and MAP3K7-binding protein 3 isoform X2 [Homalodisca vitripennis]XP_046674123.1 TGF-beta-activated kinase 1 and MAP3K7-binding protein 3 isoform X2 [Homalodisca vitripennis]
MAAEGSGRPDSLQLEETVWDFDRRLLGRQSLDSVRGAFSRLYVRDHEVSSEQCHCGRTRVSVQSAPSTPSNPLPPLTVDVRHCTTLSMDPTPHYGPSEPSRPFTSVNLTLRPPSADPLPIDISSAAGGLTYSSCSYDPRQGYQSRLQISIGPGGGGTVSAGRTLAHRPPPSLRPATSLPDVATTSSQLVDPLPPATRVRVTEQLERKEKLSRELHKYRERLSSMQLNVTSMQADLETRLRAPAPSLRVKRLREEILLLQRECNRMTVEVDRYAEIRHVNSDTLLLGETNEEFYKNIYRGQLFPRQSVRQRPVAMAGASGGGGEGHNWTCHVCTFHNHPALNKCEQCDMPRINTEPETRDIHIHVTHHNVPSSPYRRVVHSWVV